MLTAPRNASVSLLNTIAYLAQKMNENFVNFRPIMAESFRKVAKSREAVFSPSPRRGEKTTQYFSALCGLGSITISAVLAA